MSEYAAGVVVGVDGTPGSEGALRYAVVEARRRHVPLRLVHVLADGLNVVPVVAPQVLGEAGQAVLDTVVGTARELGPDLDVTGQLLVGRRSDALVSAARDAALLVLGRETRTGVDRLLTGTTTAAAAGSCVLRRGRRAVLLDRRSRPRSRRGRSQVGPRRG